MPTSIQLSNPTVTEGQHAVFELNLSGAPASGSVIALSLGSAIDTAIADTDYSSQLEYSVDGVNWQAVDPMGNFMLGAGVTRAWVRAATFADDSAEGAEKFTLNADVYAAGSMEMALASGSGNAYIQDPAVTELPTVSVNNTTVTEGTDKHAVFTVSLSPANPQGGKVTLALASGSATLGADFSSRLEVFDGTAWRPYDASAGPSFGPGVTAVKVRTAIVDDTAVESNETFTLKATPGDGVGGVAATGTATIVDNDLSRVSVSNTQVIEGPNSFAVFKVSLDKASASASTLKLALSNGTALAGKDYANALEVQVGGKWVPYDTAKGLSLAAGVTSVNVRARVLDDKLVEAQETFRLTATPVSGAGLAKIAATGTATILDNDLPSVSIDRGATVTEGRDSHAVFTVKLSQASQGTAVVKLSLADGPAPTGGQAATSGKDYGALEVLQGTTWVRYDPAKGLSFAPGTSAIQVRAAITNDTFKENSEAFTLKAEAASGATGSATATATILDNDKITVNNETYQVPNSTPLTGNVLRNDVDSEGSPLKVMGFSTNSNLNGPLPGGYFAPGSTLEIAGKGSVTMDAQGNFSFTPLPGYTSPLAFADIKLYYVVNDNTEVNGGFGFSELGTASIVVRPPLPDISVSSSSVSESAGTGGWTVGFAKAMPFDGQITLNIKGGTAAAGADYSTLEWSRDGITWTAMPGDGKVAVASGTTALQVRVKVIDDAAIEPNETVVLGASLTSDGQPGVTRGAEGTLTIVDNDQVVVRSISDAAAVEGHALGFDVAFSQATVAPSRLKFTLADGTAVGSGTEADYLANGRMWVLYQKDGQSHWLQAVDGVVTVPAGVSGVKVHIDAIDDTRIESSETFRLSAEMGGTTVTGTGTIIDNDLPPPPPPPTMSIADSSVVEGDSGQKMMVFTVTRSGDLSVGSTASYKASNGSADGSDYSSGHSGLVQFLAGESSKTISIPVYGDTVVEGNETFSVTLDNVYGATLSRGTATGTIINDDVAPPPPLPTLSIADSSIVEGHSGQQMMNFTVTRSGDLSGGSVAVYRASNGSADGSDYNSGQWGLVQFFAGESSKTISIPVYGDTVVEGNETFTVSLSSAQGATVSRDTATGTIINDDVAPPPVVPTVSVNDITIIELRKDSNGKSYPDGTPNWGSFTVSLSQATTVPVTVTLRTQDGTAVTTGNYDRSTMDYSAIGSVTVTFQPGETSKQVSVAVYSDDDSENEEYFNLLVTGVTNATVADGTGRCTIPENSSPLVLDLNGDGVKTVAMDAGPFYDLVGSGEARRSGWVDGKDGFIVRDLNGDGQINDGRELFGEGTVLANGQRASDGFEALRELDSNADGAVDARDAGFQTLKVWQDRDGDGVTDEGELLTLEQAGVASLGTGYQVSDKVENDNLHLLQGAYQTTDGQTRELTDVFFRVGTEAAREIVPVDAATGSPDPAAKLWSVSAGTEDVLIRGFDTSRDTLDLRDLFPDAGHASLDSMLGVHREGNDSVIVVEGQTHAERHVILAGVDMGTDPTAMLQQLLQAERVLV